MPSKKVTRITIIVLILLIGIISFDALKDYEWNFGKDKKEKIEEAKKEIEVIFNDNLGSADTDGDGLLDWQENLYKTDPNNPDTDGDGTLDGIEIIQRRDPYVAGPDDSVDFLKQNKENNEEEFVSTGTLTENVAVNLISNYFNLQNEEGDVEEGPRIELGKQIVSETKELAKIPDKYKASDITTFPDYEKEKTKAYGEDFAQLYMVSLYYFSTLENKDNEVYINSIAFGLDELGKFLSKIPVPSGLLNVHLEFINNLNIISSSYKAITSYENDPLRTLTVLQEYENANKRQVILLKEIADYLKANDIIFGNEEYGKIWTTF